MELQRRAQMQEPIKELENHLESTTEQRDDDMDELSIKLRESDHLHRQWLNEIIQLGGNIEAFAQVRPDTLSPKSKESMK